MLTLLRKIFGRIWALWAVMIFFISWPFVFLAYMLVYRFLNPELKYKRGFWVSKIWGHFVNFFIGVRLKTIGQENLQENGVYVYVCNHRSQIDIPINFTTNHQPFVILSKKEATKIPVVGTNLKYAHVTVDRKNPHSRKESMEELSQHLQAGRSVLIYPEGRRNRTTDHLVEFKKGAFLLAIQHQIPIVPITIIGSEKVNNPTSPFEVFPGQVTVYFDEPISTTGLTKANLDSLIKETKQTMLQHFL